MASEMFAMSVDPANRCAISDGRSTNFRPRPRRLCRYNAARPASCSNSAVRRARLHDSTRAAGRERARVEAAHDLGSSSSSCFSVLGPHVPPSRTCARGTMFGASPPVGDDAVDAVGVLDVLAQEADRGLRHGQRVGRVHAELGIAPRRARSCRGSARRTLGSRGTACDRGRRATSGGPSSPRARRRTPPVASMRILPPPRSSAGVPMTFTVMPSSSAIGASASPAPTAAAAITLWPHA